jgi:hypothetical protein
MNKSEVLTAEQFRNGGGLLSEDNNEISDIDRFQRMVRPIHTHKGKQSVHPVKVISRASP